MHEHLKIDWRRTNADQAIMSELMRRSDARAFAQVIARLSLYAPNGWKRGL